MQPQNPSSGVHSPAYLNWLAKNGAPDVYFAPHGTEEDIRKNLKPLRPAKWVKDGPFIMGTTEHGEVKINIGSDYILISSEPGEDGLPQLKKLV